MTTAGSSEIPVSKLARLGIGHNASWLVLGTLVARLSGLAMVIVFARELAVADYGLYALALAVGAVLDPLTDLGMTPYLVREVAQGEGGRTPVRALARAKAALVGAALLVTTAVTAATAGSEEFAVAIVAMAASMLLDSGANFVFGYFQGRESMRLEARMTAVVSCIRAVGAIVIALATHELVPVLAWLLAVSAGQLALAVAVVRRDLRVWSTDTVPAHPIDWHSVLAMGLIAIFAIGYLRLDAIVIGVALDREAVALYAAAYALVFGLQIIPLKIATALGPALARGKARDRDALVAIWRDGLLAVLLTVLPLTLATSLLAEPLVTLLFGSRFSEAGTALAVLVWSSPVWAVNMVLTGVLRAAGAERAIAKATGAGLALNLAVNVWAIPTYGIVAAAAATIATELLVLAVQSLLVARRGVVPSPELPWARLALAMAVGGGGAIACRGVGVVAAFTASVAGFATLAAITGLLRRRRFVALGTSLGSV